MPALTHVSLWIDNTSLDDSAFSHACDWAVGLDLPVRAVATAASDSRKTGQFSMVERLKAFGDACTQLGVSLETHLTADQWKRATERFLRPGGLCVLSGAIASPRERDLFERSSRDPQICQLLCPRVQTRIRRMLILCHQTSIDTVFLESASRICQELDTMPIILVLAKTEREAQVKQGYIEGFCNSIHLDADLDSMVHGNVADAVVRVAAWRGCSHVIVQRQADSSCWEHMYPSLIKQLFCLSAPISLLTVAESTALEVPHRLRGSRTILPWGKENQSPVVATRCMRE